MKLTVYDFIMLYMGLNVLDFCLFIEDLIRTFLFYMIVY